jgi:hypothetical protein
VHLFEAKTVKFHHQTHKILRASNSKKEKGHDRMNDLVHNTRAFTSKEKWKNFAEKTATISVKFPILKNS